MPNVDDKDVDWDDGDDDLDFNEEMSEEEVKRIMESMANKKQTAAGDGAADLDVSQWFKIGLIKLKKKNNTTIDFLRRFLIYVQRIFEMFTIVKKKVIHYGSKFSYFGSRRDPHKRLPQLGFYPVYILNNSSLLENALVFISHWGGRHVMQDSSITEQFSVVSKEIWCFGICVRKLAPPSTNQFSNLTDSLFRHSRFCAGFQGSLPDFTFDVCVCFFFLPLSSEWPRLLTFWLILVCVCFFFCL